VAELVRLKAKFRSVTRATGRQGAFLAAAVLLAGCASGPLSDVVTGSSYQPSNIYRQSATIPNHVRRVAVLPVTVESQNFESSQVCDELQAIVFEALNRHNRFELVSVSPNDLKLWTGNRRWSADEKLPSDFFDKLRTRLGCDAVLFSKLTAYRPYAPLTIGWNLKLADAESPSIWWAADEVFDAGDKQVANAARRFYKETFNGPAPLSESKTVLWSPQRFSQYTLSALFDTLPAR